MFYECHLSIDTITESRFLSSSFFVSPATTQQCGVLMRFSGYLNSFTAPLPLYLSVWEPEVSWDWQSRDVFFDFRLPWVCHCTGWRISDFCTESHRGGWHPFLLKTLPTLHLSEATSLQPESPVKTQMRQVVGRALCFRHLQFLHVGRTPRLKLLGFSVYRRGNWGVGRDKSWFIDTYCEPGTGQIPLYISLLAYMTLVLLVTVLATL